MTNSTPSMFSATAGLKHAAMAGSALAFVMGAAAPANATVITHTLATPIVFSLNTPSSAVFDLNGDGTVDYALFSTGGCSPTTTCSIGVVPNGGNKVYNDIFNGSSSRPLAAMYSSFGTFKSDFYAGNPFKAMQNTGSYMAISDNMGAPGGDWTFDTGTGVLGLEFLIGSKNDLGYIHGTVSNPTGDTNLSIAIDSYGYDAVPEADTLSLLAMGVVGVGALRRRRKSVKA